MQGVTSSLEQDLRQRVVKSDNNLRDAINKLAQSKSVSESLAAAVANNVQPVVQNAFKDAFAQVLIPAFERSLQTMLTQLGQNYVKGSKDIETQFKNQAAQMSREQHKVVVEPLLREVREKLATEFSKSSKLDQLIPVIRDAVSMEVRKSLVTPPNVAALASPAASVVSPSTPTFAELQRSVQSEIVRGDINGAFQTALSANSLRLVVATCEMVNPMQVFSQDRCPLSQPVLLALIQQLGN